MIVRVRYFKKSVGGAYEEQIYSDVERIDRTIDEYMDEILRLKIKGHDLLEDIQITQIDKKDDHPALVSGIWLMNNEGKTIERLI